MRMDVAGMVITHAFPTPYPSGAVACGVHHIPCEGTQDKSGLDDALGVAGSEGFCLLELPAAVTPAVDSEIVQLVADLVSRALHPSRPADAACERNPSGIRLAAHRVAVGASHNDQVRALRRELAARGHDEVTVETANRLQGLEFDPRDRLAPAGRTSARKPGVSKR